ncbi:V-type ATPase 116kda subunit family protein, putative [Ichthyophthirius multifiliis]|uniref:V-type proton ATPase subunit a n=1 Tax=Ichthyophthirius multifiliis TaxID=5932 RepID=G0R6I8_ICHMU|nr:V-type ATPase 116kda subunit family protein, putative [Ichthyophthirius multifiliis]EGR26919.1 V-type ATPase 116kda subunit family protein, putative [Ichthyophthirius multifiliis]|eukprot:XP_004023803.1 V-type ATPase 116kda subunit family protein, putative [Ichthyophthirius multifiliis]
MFRSEKMSLYCILMPREGAWYVLNELGDLGMVHFVDSDSEIPLFNRPYFKQIKRCEESQQKLQWIEDQMYKFNEFNDTYIYLDQCKSIEQFQKYLKNEIKQINISDEVYFQTIENEIEQRHLYLDQLLNNYNNVLYHRNTLILQRLTLQEAYQITFDKNIKQQQQLQQQQQPENLTDKIQITFLAGVINQEDENRFQKIIFRASKGNVWSHIKKIDQNNQKQGFKLIPLKGFQHKKSIFILLYSAGYNSYLDLKLRKICSAFNSFIFNINTFSISQDLFSIEQQIEDCNRTINISQSSIYDYFDYFQKNNGICSTLEYFKLILDKEKAIQTNLNYLIQNGQSFYKGLIWIQESNEQNIIQKFSNQKQSIISSVQFHRLENYTISPPTKFISNQFLNPFQLIVNTYGIPRYREINPAFFTIISFPFLFGVMFGDIGHGFLIFILGIYLMFLSEQKQKDKNSLLSILYSTRYMITLMGFFALFNGFIYNDFMSIPLNIFNSCYQSQDSLQTQKVPDCTYKVGIDPVWSISQNKLQLQNSLKMKTSVILGISQMLLGVFLKGLNSIEQINFIDFFFEFIPQVIFLTCTFGYMVFLIILKWNFDFTQNTNNAPSILNYMLNIALQTNGVGTQQDLYQNQKYDQQILFLAAIISVPFMLFPKPIINNYLNQRKKQKNGYIQFENEENRNKAEKFLEQNFKLNIEKHSEHQFSDEFVHQTIETIEFVLGSISHTASYLRLWALSLAHSQLAEVFFDKTLKNSLNEGSTFGLIVGFLIFALVTFGVLICMDAMECFLHTLRLHWVEFQSKFYKADGYIFKPFCFKSILEDQLDKIQN